MSSLRRLAKDHASLRKSLPPCYVFPSEDSSESLPDDLTQLLVYLTGSEGTPFSTGLWLLHLRIPPDYPKSPPKATFKTRIFHPNVDESTGAVCLETLKRDWDPKLTLKDILVTISCLLIHPNPDSALNEKAGVLVRENYEGFVRQAKLMTKIHAPIPPKLGREVEDARARGEVKDTSSIRPSKKDPVSQRDSKNTPQRTTAIGRFSEGMSDLTKENDTLQHEGKTQTSLSESRSHVLGKRPLTETVISTSNDGPDGDPVILPPDQASVYMEESERPRKSPKHTHVSQANGREATPEIHGILVSQELSKTRAGGLSSKVTSGNLNPHRLPSTTSKYRSYARVGIKRL